MMAYFWYVFYIQLFCIGDYWLTDFMRTHSILREEVYAAAGIANNLPHAKELCESYIAVETLLATH